MLLQAIADGGKGGARGKDDVIGRIRRRDDRVKRREEGLGMGHKHGLLHLLYEVDACEARGRPDTRGGIANRGDEHRGHLLVHLLGELRELVA